MIRKELYTCLFSVQPIRSRGGGEGGVGKLLGDISVPIHTTHTAHKQTDTQTYKHTHTHTLPHILGRVLRELQL